jgi:hypothetical protein
MIETMSEAASRISESPDLAALREINAIANALSFEENGFHNSCIYTSAALSDALVRLGYQARMLRVEAAVYPPCTCCHGSLLGFRGDGTRRPAASPGMWNGHVAVVVDETYLLDPTLDQVEGAEPFVGVVTPEFLAGEKCIFWFDGVRHLVFPEDPRGQMTRYFAFPKRCGWKGASAYRCSRRALVDQIVRAAEAKGVGRTLDQAA